MVLTLVKKKTQTIDNDDPLRCLYDLDEKSLENLFEGIIKELIFFSNFFLYNNYSRVSLPQPQKEDNKIVFTVNNKENQALIFTYDEYLKYNSK